MDGVVRQAIRAAGEVLLTVGLVGLLFIGYLVWGPDSGPRPHSGRWPAS